MNLPGALKVKQAGREMEILANGNSEPLLAELKARQPEELRMRIADAGGNFRGIGHLEKSERMNRACQKGNPPAAAQLDWWPCCWQWSRRSPGPTISMSRRLLFFGLTIMALTTIGRETSLNTFSLLLAQPAERMRIWQTKLSVLAGAFLIVFVVWLAAFGIAFLNSSVDADRPRKLPTICSSPSA